MFKLKTSILINYTSALKRLIFNQLYVKEMKQQNIPLCKEINEMILEIKNHLSGIVYNDLEWMLKKYHIELLAEYYGLNEEDMTIEVFLKRIESFSPQEFVQFYRKNIYKVGPEGEYEKIKESVEFHKNNNMVIPIPTLKDFKEFEKDIEQIAPRIVQGLTHFYEAYRPYETMLKNRREQQYQLFENLLKDEEAFAKKLLLYQGPQADYKNKTIEVYLDTIGYGDIKYLLEEDRLRMVVACELSSFFEEKTRAEWREEIFKCLADSTKVKIIQLVARENVCSRDIAKQLKLNKATISYHMGKLMMAGILKIGVQEGKKAYYEVQKQIIKEHFEEFLNGIE